MWEPKKGMHEGGNCPRPFQAKAGRKKKDLRRKGGLVKMTDPTQGARVGPPLGRRGK